MARGFGRCDSSERLLYIAYLLLVGVAYLMALTYLYTGYQGIDGKPGLSVTDVADNYYGNRSGTRLESALRGPMAAYISNQQRDEVMAWLAAGAARDAYEQDVRPILAERCIGCHRAANGAVNANGPPDLTSYVAVRRMANIDTGVSLHTLMKVSHIHLFGIAFLLLTVGMIFRRVRLRSWLKSTLILLPFIAVFVDIAAWFLTKWDPIYAYTVVVAGALLGVGLAGQILIALYQLFFVGDRDEAVASAGHADPKSSLDATGPDGTDGAG